MRKFSIAVAITLLSISSLRSQSIWEHHSKEVYNYLSRMAQKGVIVFDDNIRPLSRNYIAACLDSLSARSAQLSTIEKKELAFYSQEYGGEMADSLLSSLPTQTNFLKKDPYNRWRSFYASQKNMVLVADPVFTAATYRGSGRSFNKTSSGLNFWGRIGKHWGFQFFYNDITEAGTGLDTSKQGTNEPGYVKRDAFNQDKSLNYSQLRGSISYSWKNGSLSFGQDQLLWGYGENGRMVLSDKSPAYPYIRFDYRLFPWLSFHYTHAWLSSRIIDSAETYITGTGVLRGERIIYVPKFLATHSAQIRLTKGLNLAIGESIVYSDRLDIGYLFPLMFFKVYDNMANNGNINAGSNGQLFAQLSSRNNIPKTHIYSTVFIDEIRMATVFNSKKSRNQLGLNLGASVTDLFIPYLTIGLEYTKIRPFVYRNLLPAQDYTSHNFLLGDWMGNNADRFIYTMKYTPAPRLKCLFRYQYIRKGGPGTIHQQYFDEPQPPFLFDFRKTQQELFFSVSYELLNNLNFNGFYSSLTEKNQVTLSKTTSRMASLGFTYGL